MPGTAPPPLLTYAFSTGPDPLVVDSAGSITLAVDNKTGARVTCQSIVVTLPLGTNAGDLIATTPVTVVPANGWTVAQDGGVIILTPPGGSANILGGGLTFVFAFTTNGQPGSVTVTIDETASGKTGGLMTRSIAFSTAKFPADFAITGALAQYPAPADIAYNATAQLTWAVTGEGVTCWLDYQPADEGPPVHAQVRMTPKGGFYTTVPLTRSDSVNFILTAEFVPPGQDEPLTLQSNLSLNMETMKLTLYTEPPITGMNGLVRLRWVAENADHCIDEDTGATLPASGERYVLLQAPTTTFNISAVGSGGQVIPQQANFTMDPTIVANAPAQSVAGIPGTPGNSAMEYMAGRTIEGPNWVWEAPTAGTNGGDAVLTVALPPLDSQGGAQQVVPITLVAGSGGGGGSGEGQFSDAPSGSGGNATLDLSWDPNASTSALYLISLTAGASGGEGAPAGTASATVDGYTLTLP
jgi:hypothetical protein